MSKVCIFCGSASPLTREHTLSAWLGRIGLPNQAVKHTVGRLNRSAEERGVSPPFMRTVREVCASCNNGWVSSLDAAAKTALTDPVCGRRSVIAAADCGPVAAWFQKICLVNMLSTPDASTVRDSQLGAEMRALFEARDRMSPLSATSVWIGRVASKERLATVCLTPMVAGVVGLPVAVVPNAYAMTLTVGELLLHGIRFTTPLLAFDVAPMRAFTQLWPSREPVTWPWGSDPVNDAQRVTLESGRLFRPADPRFTLDPWKPATSLPDQEIDGHWMRIATPCGQHFARYPLPLALEGQKGGVIAFVLSCECPRRYLVVADRTGVRFTCESRPDDAGGPDFARAEYDRLDGAEHVLEGSLGTFIFKQLEPRSTV